jgi:hypothetical protein
MPYDIRSCRSGSLRIVLAETEYILNDRMAKCNAFTQLVGGSGTLFVPDIALTMLLIAGAQH